ncbi:hypothetical protein ACTU45_30085 [Streptomyces sp. 24-1644]|uniref:hypothetical protein n=1 Tax=Streptomyces sp. 24-1644 TaxID=3457315 RepID=UPI003FA6D616
MRKLATVLASAAVLMGCLAAPAVAAPEPITSPYAQAAADVQGDGTLLRAKNIDAVRRIDVGRYCVKVNNTVDVSKSIVQVELPSHLTRTYTTSPTPECGNAANTVYVRTFTTGGAAYIDIPFTVAVL